MLVLSRRVNERISVFKNSELIAKITVLGIDYNGGKVFIEIKAREDIDNFESIFSLMIVDVDPKKARLGLQASSDIRFYRDEIIAPENTPFLELPGTIVMRGLHPQGQLQTQT